MYNEVFFVYFKLMVFEPWTHWTDQIICCSLPA